ncbi:MAG: hypothetical protein P8Y60_14330 [Calditrichota bacterium]
MDWYMKLKSSFLVIIVIMAAGEGVLLWNQNTLKDAFHAMRSSFELEEYLLECRRQEKNFFLRQDSESVRLYQESFDSLRNLTSALSMGTINPDIREKFITMEQAERTYRSLFDNMVQLMQSQPAPPDTFETPTNALVTEARRIHAMIFDVRSHATEQFTKTRATTHVINLTTLLVSVFVSVILAGFLSDKIRSRFDARSKKDL